MKKEWMNSIVVRYMRGFLIILLSTLAAFVFVYDQAYDMAQKITYEKLSSQAENYLHSFDNELIHVQRLQNEFFNDRKLVFIIAPNMTALSKQLPLRDMLVVMPFSFANA